MKHLPRFINSKLNSRSTPSWRAPKPVTWLALGAYLLCGTVIIMFATPIFGWRALNVLTPSMKPHISPGDLVLVHRVPISSIHKGDIITYNDLHQPGVTITHRVVGMGVMKGVPTIITKGDANQAADAPVPDGRVVGKVQTVVPGLGRVLGWLHSPLALMLLIIIPGLLVIWAESKRLRRLLATTPETHPVRRLDGVYYRASALAAVLVLVALATGSTLAQLTATVSLNGNVFTVTDNTTPSPTPSTPSPHPTPNPTTSPSATPCANVTISNTAAGSTNTVHCTSTFSSRSSSNTSVSITSNSTQSATSGNITINGNTVTGDGTPGSVSNNFSSSIDINVSQ